MSAPAIQSIAPVLTCSTRKAVVEASATPEGVLSSAAVGSSSVAHSMVLAMASQSEATIPSLRERKMAVPNASVTSSSIIPISALIENVDMEDLIKVYQVDQKYNPIYICIQEFMCRAPLLEECPQHHGHKGDPGVTPGTCGAIGERAQVILVWVRAPGRWERLPPTETRSHED